MAQRSDTISRRDLIKGVIVGGAGRGRCPGPRRLARRRHLHEPARAGAHVGRGHCQAAPPRARDRAGLPGDGVRGLGRSAPRRGRHPPPHRGRRLGRHAARRHAARGEALTAVDARVRAALAALIERHRGETVILVSHAIVTRLIVLAALGLGPDRLWSVDASPAGITEIEYLDAWATVHCMNTLAHLDGLREDGA